jgi:hypothetical protein
VLQDLASILFFLQGLKTHVCSSELNEECNIQSEFSLPLLFYVTQYCKTVAHTYSKTPVLISCLFFLPFFLSFFSLCLFYTNISEHGCVPLQCLYKGCIQSNQKLSLSQLMFSIHCDCAIFPYHELERRRPAQETLIGCEELHIQKI